MAYLQCFNPFSEADPQQLRNISTGVIADGNVNCDRAEEIGKEIISKLDRTKYGNIKLPKSQQVKTFAIMRKAVLVGDTKVCMSSTELYQRLIALAYTKGVPSPTIFSYELATTAPSMFHDDGMMRKSQKSTLEKRIIEMDEDILVEEILQMHPNIRAEPSVHNAVVLDGCA